MSASGAPPANGTFSESASVANRPVAVQQRMALAAALRSVDPDAPTLCEGWRAADLALHIVVRDSRPDLMVGQQLPGWKHRAQSAMDRLASRGYDYLVDRVKAGPPPLFPQRWAPVDNLVNTAEFYIHGQDVLRAQGGDDAGEGQASARQNVPAQHVSEQLQRALWGTGVKLFFPLAARSQGRRITFLSPRVGAVTRGRTDQQPMLVTGEPQELLLWASGREDHADVEIAYR
ncbi:TIGR03085 family metal-binding protein [Nesterenkonia flava]|uniref:TIGR03085 family metal-binding protein n=1 Tax=Nesterenkonia flava TaxID=469799 RepID=A0ABU1FUQ1_9MICC|nr:TIGR03085 family metal-binding protein [Nesterenkonia flava]MDR5712386.1 TIGR03085 family metal-binding protein [Nesterenkonia flava]